MNVVHYTPIIKNLHGHNFQSSWCIATRIGKLPLVEIKFSGCETETMKPKEEPTCLLIGVWFDLHGHNFQSSWCIATRIGKLPLVEIKFSGCETETMKPKEEPTCLLIGVWFDCGGSRSQLVS
uniref:Uncharacterized protein n=1 Tax=Solanum tuberosum TaxID=4113 RepID=M1DM61_SOLTU